jgi:hypothetical protein
MSDKNNSSNQNKGGFWTTLPGILTALGTLIAAITGLIAILHQIGFLNLVRQLVRQLLETSLDLLLGVQVRVLLVLRDQLKTKLGSFQI